MQISLNLSRKSQEFTLSISFLYKIRSKIICRKGFECKYNFHHYQASNFV